ncbi:hypothetical protein niasHT_011801 [Heterodera trifolii]|uniref:Effector protein n=1 Tax=Heterodera trifolii TaxID=157864 RepID=A0ABD2L553_9BILA
MFRKIGTFVFGIFLLLLFALPLVRQSPPRLSQMESTSSQRRHISVEEDNFNELEQSQQQKHRKKQRRTQQRPSFVGDVRAAVCPFGWLNFRDEQCFYGLSQVRLPFFFGVRACAQIQAGEPKCQIELSRVFSTFFQIETELVQLKASFCSVHSVDEFRFITANFDLRHFWIGIFFGSNYFEDGTKVDQRLFEQISPMVPWAPPQTLKGFVCRAVPQFHYGNDKDSK